MLLIGMKELTKIFQFILDPGFGLAGFISFILFFVCAPTIYSLN